MSYILVKSKEKGDIFMMYISGCKERCIALASYLIENKATVRTVAAKFGISKSTVHKDISQNLEKINKPLYLEARKILELNKKERHLRGGEATKKKFLKKGEL